MNLRGTCVFLRVYKIWPSSIFGSGTEISVDVLHENEGEAERMLLSLPQPQAFEYNRVRKRWLIM